LDYAIDFVSGINTEYMKKCDLVDEVLCSTSETEVEITPQETEEAASSSQTAQKQA
jgi:hypothetical protein